DLFDVDSADGALLELDRVARTNQARGQLADAGLVADQRDACLARVLLEVGDQGGVGAFRGKRIDADDRRTRVERRGDDVRGLASADERAGQDHVNPGVE